MHTKKNSKYASGKSGHLIKVTNFKMYSDLDLLIKGRPRYKYIKKIFCIEYVKENNYSILDISIIIVSKTISHMKENNGSFRISVQGQILDT